MKAVAVFNYTLEELVKQSMKDLASHGVIGDCTFSIQDCNEYLEINFQWYDVHADMRNSAKITVNNIRVYIDEITRFLSMTGLTNESSRARLDMKVLDSLTSCIHHFED